MINDRHEYEESQRGGDSKQDHYTHGTVRRKSTNTRGPGGMLAKLETGSGQTANQREYKKNTRDQMILYSMRRHHGDCTTLRASCEA